MNDILDENPKLKYLAAAGVIVWMVSLLPLPYRCNAFARESPCVRSESGERGCCPPTFAATQHGAGSARTAAPKHGLY